MVPLVATTSIVTILLLCLVLLLTRDRPGDAQEAPEWAFLDGGPLGGGGGGGLGGPDQSRQHERPPADENPTLLNRPAHLRSSALELELPSVSESGEFEFLHQQQEAAQQQQQQTQQHQQRIPQMRARSAPVQHATGRKHATSNRQHQQHAASEQEQQQQQQQQQLQQRQLAASLGLNGLMGLSGSSSSGGPEQERRFDVAQIQCNNTEEGFERFACPTADHFGRFKCIEDRLFCDGYFDCPGGEDEDRVSCMYYRLFVSHIDILTNTFLTWMKSQNRQTMHGNKHHQPHHHMTTNVIELG